MSISVGRNLLFIDQEKTNVIPFILFQFPFSYFMGAFYIVTNKRNIVYSIWHWQWLQFHLSPFYLLFECNLIIRCSPKTFQFARESSASKHFRFIFIKHLNARWVVFWTLLPNHMCNMCYCTTCHCRGVLNLSDWLRAAGAGEKIDTPDSELCGGYEWVNVGFELVIAFESSKKLRYF